MFSEVPKRGKLVREVGGSKDKTNGRERDALFSVPSPSRRPLLTFTDICRCNHSSTRVRGPPVALHVRYRAPPPLESAVAPVALQLPGVSHVKLPLKMRRATGDVAATLAGVALHCATLGAMCNLVVSICFWGSPKPIHLKPGHLKMAFFSTHTFLSRRRLFCLDGAFPVHFPKDPVILKILRS